MRRTYFALVSLAAAGAAGLSFAACGGDGRSAAFDEPDGAQRTDGGLDFGQQEAAPACTGLECQQVACGGGKTTTLSGTVYAPTPAKYGKADPIYNAILYVPNGPLEPFEKGVSCEKCGTVTSGSPLVTALSGSDGKFVLENVPAGDDIPLVIQVGRWRRQVTIKNVKACEDNALDAEDTRLPRDSSEGDIPLMAIVTSSFDATECLMKKIGIADSEFTPGSGSGRVHLYQGGGATMPGASNGSTLWGSKATLDAYDIVAFPCSSQPSDMAGRQNIVDYADGGGRVFITDLSQDIIKNGPAPWPSTGKWNDTGSFSNPASIDTTFPKGEALADWLKLIGATPTHGQIDLTGTYFRVRDVDGASQRWVYSPESVQTYSFNTPVGVDEAAQCGRVFYSSFHVSQGGFGTFPSSCDDGPLTPQEKILEFMLFDLAACVMKDGDKPEPPPVK